MTKKVQYESLLEQLHREYGESYQTTFRNDRASFGLPPKMKPMTEAQQSTFNNPVGGNTKGFKPEADDAEQFSDENAQLEIKPSSTIQSAAYWTDRKYLVVSFKSGHTYSYSGVDMQVILWWEQAASAGSFFYYNIPMNYSYQKMG